MKAVQGIHIPIYIQVFFLIFLTLAMLFYSGLESKNKQNTDNIKTLQVTFLFSKFTLQLRGP